MDEFVITGAVTLNPGRRFPQGVVRVRQVIYIDVLVAINFTANYVLLWSAGRLARANSNWLRLTLAALTGTLYLLVLFLPLPPAASGLTVKFAFSILMLLTAFYPFQLLQFGRLVGYFYLSSVLLAGTTFIIFFLARRDLPLWVSGSQIISSSLHWWILALGIVALVSLGTFCYSAVQKRQWQESCCIPLTIHFAPSTIRVNALIDTGNELTDPLSGRPVLVVEYWAIKEAMPAEIRGIFETDGEEDLLGVTERLAASSWANRFRLIPFSSLGKVKGMLLGFRPDGVEVADGRGRTGTREVIVGVYNRRLSTQGQYNALLNPEIIQGMAGHN